MGLQSLDKSNEFLKLYILFKFHINIRHIFSTLVPIYSWLNHKNTNSALYQFHTQRTRNEQQQKMPYEIFMNGFLNNGWLRRLCPTINSTRERQNILFGFCHRSSSKRHILIFVHINKMLLPNLNEIWIDEDRTQNQNWCENNFGKKAN